MRLAFAILFVCAFCTATNAQSRNSDQSIKLLEPLIGTWSKEWTIHQTEWTPKEEKATGTHTWEWVLDNQHIRETGTDSTGSKYMSMWSYNKSTMNYRVATFQSNGNSSQMIGSWDTETNTFIATNDLGNGVTMTVKYVLSDEDSLRFSFVARDDTGKTYFHLEGIGKRSDRSERP